MVPVIDLRSKDVDQQMRGVYTTCGFAVFTHAYDSWLSEISDWKQLIEEFFGLPTAVKKQYAYS